MPLAAPGLLLTNDLIFSSKITGTAEGLGGEVLVLNSAEHLISQIQPGQTPCVFLDLGTDTLEGEDIMRIVRSARAVPVIAYGSHVDTDRMAEARDAGCTEVMARSQFSSELAGLLRRFFA